MLVLGRGRRDVYNRIKLRSPENLNIGKLILSFDLWNCSGVPYPPGRPQVLKMDGHAVTLTWDPPVASGKGGPVAGYFVEYRDVVGGSWLIANDYPHHDCQFTGKQFRTNERMNEG